MRTVFRPRNRTVRMRLTLLYGGVFLITGAVLLTIGYLLVRHNLHQRQSLHQEAQAIGVNVYRGLFGPTALPSQLHSLREAMSVTYAQATSSALHWLLLEYVGALVVMTGLSVAAGWLLAGRALAPLREITATAHRVSGENLGERIALEGADDELKDLADTFDRMLARLDSTFESQKRFVANASHELRTPLAIMRTEIDVALADPDASRQELRVMGETVREAIDRSEALIAALLMLARSEGMATSEQDVDLKAAVDRCLNDLAPQLEEAGITAKSAVEPVMIRADAALVHRMVANLLENAVRHNEPGGHVRIQLVLDGSRAELTVENGGTVLDAEDVHELMEPFRRMSRSAGGFGLGLSIVRSIVTAHNGRVELTALDEGGLLVRAQLPGAWKGSWSGTADGAAEIPHEAANPNSYETQPIS